MMRCRTVGPVAAALLLAASLLARPAAAIDLLQPTLVCDSGSTPATLNVFFKPGGTPNVGITDIEVEFLPEDVYKHNPASNRWTSSCRTTTSNAVARRVTVTPYPFSGCKWATLTCNTKYVLRAYEVNPLTEGRSPASKPVTCRTAGCICPKDKSRCESCKDNAKTKASKDLLPYCYSCASVTLDTLKPAPTGTGKACGACLSANPKASVMQGCLSCVTQSPITGGYPVADCAKCAKVVKTGAQMTACTACLSDTSSGTACTGCFKYPAYTSSCLDRWPELADSFVPADVFVQCMKKSSLGAVQACWQCLYGQAEGDEPADWSKCL